MSPYVLAGILAGLPLFLALIFRVHSSAFFISITAGYLLSQFVGDTAGLISSSFIPNDATGTTTKLVVFILPILLVIWLMRGSLPTRQIFLHIVPQIASSLLVFVLLLPLLPENIQETLDTSPLGNGARQASDVIVAVAVVLQILLMAITARPPREGKHHKK